MGVYEREKTTQQEIVQAITPASRRRSPGSRATRSSPRELRHRRHRAGIGLPEGDDVQTEAGIWQRALANIKTGNLGVLPIVIGLILIVTFFSFKATNFFTANNFNNVIVQMAGVTMLAFGVVFVLLLGEIDLSIGYLSGIAALRSPSSSFPAAGTSTPHSSQWPSRWASAH